MAKKKLLNEAQVRRFMGLAGLNSLSENMSSVYEEEEEVALDAEEGEALDAEEGELEEPMDAVAEPEMDAAAEPEAAEEEVTVTQDTIDNFGNAAMELLGQLGYDNEAAAGEAPADLPPEPVIDDPVAAVGDEEDLEADGEDELDAEEEEGVMEALSGVNLELNEDELVQEVAKRVAKRILKAKRAQKQLDEALGTKARTRTQRKRK